MGRVMRARPSEAGSRPAEAELFHGITVLEEGPTAITHKKCSTLVIMPHEDNADTVFIGSIEDEDGEELSAANGWPLSSGGMVFSVNQSMSKVRIYACGAVGDRIRYLGVR